MRSLACNPSHWTILGRQGRWVDEMVELLLAQIAFRVGFRVGWRWRRGGGPLLLSRPGGDQPSHPLCLALSSTHLKPTQVGWRVER